MLTGAEAAELVLNAAARPGGLSAAETGRGRLDVAKAMRLLKGMGEG